MKQRTKHTAAIVIAALAAVLASTAVAQSTETPRENGVYQFGDANGANGSDTERMPRGTQEDRRQSGYPQPGTAADTGGVGGSTQNTGASSAPKFDAQNK
ncbi:hypothetical protein [Paraburkholderia caballeronis]|uniref:DUF4124 domain-containing protein n=1 Tax=Paraburkholderia caballeronis TaxID=416943 RepID=A0A1H7MWS3_9BURK|nr:hypothetical protein [Paraburkholderia caballeronis]PXW26376.1 hypothetical protein C7403_104249 [Paraburkholderia caballeronis]PXX01923.1 hypothetical protein C7407_104249 [Paraburkholderia caballeronis]RAK01080.1 hypothetical protein C7409_104249 [Paraburkholderia caballeronis]TDV38283.1 hypothetical protein C7405_102490 [Paraburkholderia caballeronis]SEB99116.1 hypothetical protein SAMN05445871_1446 [Paraburkholderia caballeronis]